jgi:hypothetical protein
MSEQDKAHWSEKEWYILRQDWQYGPYSYLEVIGLLQDRKVREYDYVYNRQLTTWKKISELELFSPEKMNELRQSSWSEVRAIFFRRKHARVTMKGYLILHDGKTVFKALLKEISAGGASFELSGRNISVGQKLNFHFKPSVQVPAFNAVVGVVSLQPKDGRALKVGVKFLKIETIVQKAIKEFADKVAA